MQDLKQSIWDLREEKWKEFAKIGVVVKMDDYREIMKLKYPTNALTELFGRTPFEYELRREDFPNRNLIPVYAKNSKGKYYIDRYVQGTDAVPSPSLKRLLDSENERGSNSLIQDVVTSQEVLA